MIPMRRLVMGAALLLSGFSGPSSAVAENISVNPRLVQECRTEVLSAEAGAFCDAFQQQIEMSLPRENQSVAPEVQVRPIGFCTSDFDCGAFEKCVSGRCYRQDSFGDDCTSHFDCPPGKKCIRFKCSR